MRPNSLAKAAAFFLAAVLCVGGTNSAAFAVPLMLLSEFDRGLYAVDTSSLGAPDMKGSVGFGTDLVELVAASPNSLYAFDRASSTLVTVNATNAAVLNTVTLDTPLQVSPRGFDVSPGGTLYGVFGGLQLRTINPATGVTSLVATLSGVSIVEALGFASNGRLHAAGAPTGSASTDLYTVDLISGALSHVGEIVPGGDIDTLAYASDGFLYGATSGPNRPTLCRIDPATGAKTDAGDTGVNSIVGIAQLPAAVPEPATPALFAVALADLGFAPPQAALLTFAIGGRETVGASPL
jgi:hypothetical protein